LGSRVESKTGAREFCRVAIEMCRAETGLAETLGRDIPRTWREGLKRRAGVQNVGEFGTTGGFIFIRKEVGEVILGKRGDVTIVCERDGGKVEEVLAGRQKDFLNETEALGEREGEELETVTLRFQKFLAFLLATDGIGDELDREKLGELFEYLKENYRGGRGHNLLRRDIKETFGEKNNDDQTMIFGWGMR